MENIIIALSVVLLVVTWSGVYAEYKKSVAIDEAESKRFAEFQARWNWEMPAEERARLEAQVALSKQLIDKYWADWTEAQLKTREGGQA